MLGSKNTNNNVSAGLSICIFRRGSATKTFNTDQRRQYLSFLAAPSLVTIVFGTQMKRFGTALVPVIAPINYPTIMLCISCFTFWSAFCSPFRDVRKFKESKKQFDKVREDLDIALVKNAQAPRHKPHEVEEATGTLTITRKCFRHLALDYVLQVSRGHLFQSGRPFTISSVG